MIRRAALVPTLLLACVSAACAASVAPGAPARQIVLVTGADTMSVERYRADASGVEGAIVIRPAGLRVDYALATQGGAPERFELALRRLAAPDSAPPLQKATFTFAGDSVHVEGANGAVQSFGGMRGAWPFVNPSMALLVRAIRDVRPAPGDSAVVHLLTVSGSRTLPAVVRTLGADSVTVGLGGVAVHFGFDAHGELAGGVIPVQGVRMTCGPADDGAAFAPAPRPDYSAPAGAPYTATGVKVPVPGGYELAGTLTVPAGAKRAVPCVVTITGSGQEDRDEAIPMVKGYRPFRQVADALARRGIATLRLDDRGFGESGGDPSQATSAGFADDVRAALAWLRARPGIDGRRLVLLGHSEGGLIAPMVAADDPGVCAVVLMAAPARTGRRVIEYQQREALARVPGLSDAEREARAKEAMAKVDSSAATVPWLRYFLDYDPLPTARRVHVPVLVLQGATDRQVEQAQAQELGAALRAGGNRDVTVQVLPGVDHLFLDDPSGDPAGYVRLPDHEIRPAVLAAITDWLAPRVK